MDLKKMAKVSELSRDKTHWDFLLEEMAWLAKDFDRERRWKMGQAKKIAQRASRAKSDFEFKELRKKKDEEQKIKRLAANIGRDVKKFWGKIEKLVLYKHQMKLEEKKKEAVNKHLNFLLGQTERYSSMLAQNLGDVKISPVVNNTSVDVLDESKVSIPMNSNLDAFDRQLETSFTGVEPAQIEHLQVKKQTLDPDLSLEFTGNKDEKSRVEPNEDEESGDTNYGDFMNTVGINGDADYTNSHSTDGNKVENENDNDNDDAAEEEFDETDGEYDFNGGDELEDDERTLEEEEAMALEDDEGERIDEISMLEKEKEIPVEEILKMYEEGSLKQLEENERKITSKEVSEVNQDHKEKEKNAKGYIGKKRKKKMRKTDVINDENDEEFTVSLKTFENLHDDETTLEEDENQFTDAERKNELDLLEKESEMPIEELLKMYQMLAEDNGEIKNDNENENTDGGKEKRSRKKKDKKEVRDVKENECTVENITQGYQENAENTETEGSFPSNAESQYQKSPSNVKIKSHHQDDQDNAGKQKNDTINGVELNAEGRTNTDTKYVILPNSNGFKDKGKRVHEGGENHSQPSPNFKIRKIEYNDFDNDGPQNGNESLRTDIEKDEKKNLKEGKTQKIDDVCSNGEHHLQHLGADVIMSPLDPNFHRINLRDETQRGQDQGKINKGQLTSQSASHLQENENHERLTGVYSATDGLIKVEHGKDVSCSDDEDEDNDAKLIPSENLIPDLIPSGTICAKPTPRQLNGNSGCEMGSSPTAAKFRTQVPFLLKFPLREYQHIGLDWLVAMYEKRLNGILADEMGLGKTIMTIGLLAYLACEKGIWGPHLIVVPTSVMLNWETEFMKWCPAFKLLTYFGSFKERKQKRQGWSKPNSFHICITTYRLVIQDAKSFRRKKWKYLILDEAHLIKNWKSQRWLTLLNLNSKRRLLLTGTPLQNDLMELWSLMHFLMPYLFQSHQEFKDWFVNPIAEMVEGGEKVNKEVIDRLHNVLRPFLLRRLKRDVETQLPQKHEHVIRCQLSKRQRQLYEDFIARSDTQSTLASGNFLGLINILMQLRKVCNHPDLFESRPIISSFDLDPMEFHLSSDVMYALRPCSPLRTVDLSGFHLLEMDRKMSLWEAEEVASIAASPSLITELVSSGEDTWQFPMDSDYDELLLNFELNSPALSTIERINADIRSQLKKNRIERAKSMAKLSFLRCNRRPIYGQDLINLVQVESPLYHIKQIASDPRRFLEYSGHLADAVQLPLTRLERMKEIITLFTFVIPFARTSFSSAYCSHPFPSFYTQDEYLRESMKGEVLPIISPLRTIIVRQQLFFPDRRLLQFDCGKLQELAVLLQRLKSEGHRALIFTQMTKMLDVLESFVNIYGYTYMRLDGSTKPEDRQILMQRFNTNPKYFLFILSTRSGGVGINLVGADTVIFYDSDWNPAMDQQAQDRCHRIGQTREVNIYRLVSESTIEENILKKANQKRLLDDLVIQSGEYNTEFFKRLDPRELFSGMKGIEFSSSKNPENEVGVPIIETTNSEQLQGRLNSPDNPNFNLNKELTNDEIEAALRNVEDEIDYIAMKNVEQEQQAENQEFTEEPIAAGLEGEEEGEKENEKTMEEDGKSLEERERGAKSGRGRGSLMSFTDIQDEDEQNDKDEQEEKDGEMVVDMNKMTLGGKNGLLLFEHLKPVEKYALRFLELWDKVIDEEEEMRLHESLMEKEWELDQFERAKGEHETEIEDEEDVIFDENWSSSMAYSIYKEEIEALSQANYQFIDMDFDGGEKGEFGVGEVQEKFLHKGNSTPKFPSISYDVNNRNTWVMKRRVNLKSLNVFEKNTPTSEAYFMHNRIKMNEEREIEKGNDTTIEKKTDLKSKFKSKMFSILAGFTSSEDEESGEDEAWKQRETGENGYSKKEDGDVREKREIGVKTKQKEKDEIQTEVNEDKTECDLHVPAPKRRRKSPQHLSDAMIFENQFEKLCKEYRRGMKYLNHDSNFPIHDPYQTSWTAPKDPEGVILSHVPEGDKTLRNKVGEEGEVKVENLDAQELSASKSLQLDTHQPVTNTSVSNMDDVFSRIDNVKKEEESNHGYDENYPNATPIEKKSISKLKSKPKWKPKTHLPENQEFFWLPVDSDIIKDVIGSKRGGESNFRDEKILFPQSWLPIEDCVLCACICRYGTNWSLACDLIRSLPDGSFSLNGIFKSDLECRRRFGFLFVLYTEPETKRKLEIRVTPTTLYFRVNKEILKQVLEHIHELTYFSSHFPNHFTPVISMYEKYMASKESIKTQIVMTSDSNDSETKMNPRLQKSPPRHQHSNIPHTKIPFYRPDPHVFSASYKHEQSYLSANAKKQTFMFKSFKDRKEVESSTLGMMNISAPAQFGSNSEAAKLVALRISEARSNSETRSEPALPDLNDPQPHDGTEP